MLEPLHIDLFGRLNQLIQAPDFIALNIIKPNDKSKSIQKKIVQPILKSTPIQKLKQNTQLTKFLHKNGQKLVQQLTYLYDKCKKFKLMKFGQFCACQKEDNNNNKKNQIQEKNSYVIFSDHMIAYVKLGKNNYQGLCYRFGVSVYIGQFNNMLGHGNGIALFLENTKNQKGEPIKIYHQFKGTWKDGQIIQGTRKTYLNQIKIQSPLFQYKGKFNNFQFHDQSATFIHNKQQFKLKFEKGKIIKHKIGLQGLQKIQEMKKRKSLITSNLEQFQLRKSKSKGKKGQIGLSTSNRVSKSIKFY